MSKLRKNHTFLQKAATFIVDKRSLFFLLYAFAIIFCLFSMRWVTVENDVPTGTAGIAIMEAARLPLLCYIAAAVLALLAVLTVLYFKKKSKA